MLREEIKEGEGKRREGRAYHFTKTGTSQQISHACAITNLMEDDYIPNAAYVNSDGYISPIDSFYPHNKYNFLTLFAQRNTKFAPVQVIANSDKWKNLDVVPGIHIMQHIKFPLTTLCTTSFYTKYLTLILSFVFFASKYLGCGAKN